MQTFDHDKAQKIASLIAELFPHNPESAAVFCANLLLNIIPCDHCAREILELVVNARNEFSTYGGQSYDNQTSH